MPARPEIESHTFEDLALDLMQLVLNSTEVGWPSGEGCCTDLPMRGLQPIWQGSISTTSLGTESKMRHLLHELGTLAVVVEQNSLYASGVPASLGRRFTGSTHRSRSAIVEIGVLLASEDRPMGSMGVRAIEVPQEVGVRQTCA